ncbi:DC-STAMP domain-containing protein 2-like [Nymphalis io]|uniref:DC-STAMP domain-containing protein 2-like n=1 Tax=Inachis io TaxID=171585 RepID=UPI00216A8CEB|nr:DC-STAMP domain-containing protein 2-like [Nymphalis io]
MTGHLKKWFPDGSSVSNLYFYLKSDHALPRFVLKSFIGFVCGIVLTYLCFIFFVFQLSISLIHATIMSSIIGVLLTLGLAFSCRIRCLIFLLIPQLFSRVGRYTLTCYALVLILTGPATNTLKNSEVLTESMACSQEQIKTDVRHISETVKKPFNAMKESIKLMVDEMKRVASKMNKIISKISIMVTSIADLIQSSYSWLNSVANICHQTFGTPYDHCLKSIERGERNYMKTAGKDFIWRCNDSAANSACLAVKSYKTVCVVSDYATTSYAATLKRRLRNYITRINTTFFLNVRIHHTYSYSSNESSTPNQMAAGIVTEIRKRADPLLTWLSWSSCITSLFLMLIIFRAKYYQHMFATRSRYDNRYVTKELRDLDFKRYQERRETVLPLNRREQAKYICISSFRLVSSEKVYLTRSIIFMAITTFKLLIHMVADYSLYWVLITIRHHGRLQTPLSLGPSDAGVHVSGSGIVRDFIRSLLDSITSPLLSQRTIKVNCLPNPYPPDLQRYTQIAILIILLWFFALFEPYGLRFRHVIVGHYQPDRAKTRAVWLYNHIIRTRGSFMKLARRKLHREYKYSNHENQTFRYWLDSILPCVTLNCPGVYCLRCFSDIGRLCTICLSPKDYGDMSDVSLEKGSSDESDTDECKEKGTERERLIKKPEKLNMCEIASTKMKNDSNEQTSVLPDIGRYEDVNKRNGSNNNSIINTYTVNGYYATENYKDTENENPIQNDITREYNIAIFTKIARTKAYTFI